MDTIKFTKTLSGIPNVFKTDEYRVEWQNLTWKKKGDFKYSTTIKNLYIQLKYDNLSITNSLHEFKHGDNFSIFTFVHLKEALEELNTYFTFDIYDLDVIKFTPGLVVEATPEDSYETWLHYKSKKLLDMPDGNKAYGKSIKTGDIKIKGYNKTYQINKKNHIEHKLTDPQFRLEAEMNAKYVAKNHGLSILKVSDLADYKKYCKSLDLLLKLYDEINKDHIDYSKLSCNQFRTLGIFLDDKMFSSYKKYHPHSYKKDNKIFKSIIEDKSYTKTDTTRSSIVDMMNTMKKN